MVHTLAQKPTAGTLALSVIRSQARNWSNHLIAELVDEFAPREGRLFGSVARGDDNADSDIYPKASENTFASNVPRSPDMSAVAANSPSRLNDISQPDWLKCNRHFAELLLVPRQRNSIARSWVINPRSPSTSNRSVPEATQGGRVGPTTTKTFQKVVH